MVVGLLPPMPGASGRGSDGGNDSGGRGRRPAAGVAAGRHRRVGARELPHLRKQLPKLGIGHLRRNALMSRCARCRRFPCRRGNGPTSESTAPSRRVRSATVTTARSDSRSRRGWTVEALAPTEHQPEHCQRTRPSKLRDDQDTSHLSSGVSETSIRKCGRARVEARRRRRAAERHDEIA